MNTGSRSFVVFESICEELLGRLNGDGSERGRGFIYEAHELLGILGRWREEPPTQDQRTAAITRVLDLHRRAMEHLTLSAHRSQEH